MPKPHKRPSQNRARFTVEAIYDAYVRIWRREGQTAVTTRAVAEEAGFAVGTLYEYFPNKTALHSGYVRFTIDWLLARIDRDVIAASFPTWRHGVHRLVGITCGHEPDQPYFDMDMLDLVNAVAEPWHHTRVFEELAEKWSAAIHGWADIPRSPTDETIEALVIAVWGARRYALLVDPDNERISGWTEQLTRLCLLTLEPD
ncbi:TetR/AcrR family transcriptional regulator [Mesorhizobium xinjiangense]|uniref:TetR/AcrR family transcriptional regulator n=1 Tax=Mesorhizobium xinjiangense TaxID=2678685 RepID=UPI0018DB38D6|nr:TetR/AcrR family transcriptional regulator [Mesorhizobium xinjiangense]